MQDGQLTDTGWIAFNPQFRSLSLEEIEEYKEHARHAYTAGTPISRLWHPVYATECNMINLDQKGYIITLAE